MKSKIKKLPDYCFENDDEISRFIAMIKTEYLKNLYKTYFWLFILVVAYSGYKLILTPLNQTNAIFIMDQFAIGMLFSFYLLIYFFNLSYARFTPTVISFLENELSVLDLKFERKYNIKLSNYLFICLSIIVFIFLVIGINLYYQNNEITLIIRFLIIFFFTGITIPVLRGTLHDIILVRLRNSYFVQIELQLKLIKRKEVQSQMVKIFMTSNKLGKKSNPSGYALFTEISEKRWLQRKDSRFFPGSIARNNLIFHEYATVLNFKENILNLVSAIREWDIIKARETY